MSMARSKATNDDNNQLTFLQKQLPAILQLLADQQGAVTASRCSHTTHHRESLPRRQLRDGRRGARTAPATRRDKGRRLAVLHISRTWAKPLRCMEEGSSPWLFS
jgi:hypothetical protein